MFLFVWQAKDHAKMRIKEVKSRLKQKVCSSALLTNHSGSFPVVVVRDCILSSTSNDGDSSWSLPHKNTFNTTLTYLYYLDWTPPPQPQRAASLPLPIPLQCHHSFRPCQPPPPCVPPLQEHAENGFPTAGPAVIDDDNTEGFTSSTGSVRREGPLRALDNHRPITVHFGQVGRNDVGWECGEEDILKSSYGISQSCTALVEQRLGDYGLQPMIIFYHVFKISNKMLGNTHRLPRAQCDDFKLESNQQSKT